MTIKKMKKLSINMSKGNTLEQIVLNSVKCTPPIKIERIVLREKTLFCH